MLFIRNFTGFSGGHLKFLDYLHHTAASGLARPVLYQTPKSRTVPGNIFNACGIAETPTLHPFPSYFLAGMDWSILDDAAITPGSAPVINLIQGLRHAEPATPLFTYLSRPALRICVSPAIADAIRPHANGPVQIIQNGITLSPLPAPPPLGSPARILIAGFKNPGLAHTLAANLRGTAEIDLTTEHLPRPEFLSRIAAATVCIFLPLEQEGFFLPPLEAMALGHGVITPDCGGNRAYCRPGENCLMPAYTAEALTEAASRLLQNPLLLARLTAEGLKTAQQLTLDQERSAYISLLSHHLAERQA